MSIKSDKWIRRMAEEHRMIEPFEAGQVREVNGQKIVDHWSPPHGPVEASGTIALTAGVKYDITMEYYENGGGAAAKLFGSSPSTTKQVIPQAQLYPAIDPNADTTAPAAITAIIGIGGVRRIAIDKGPRTISARPSEPVIVIEIVAAG